MSADGPMGDLDEELEMDMMHFFMNMKKAEGITFVLVTHDSDLVKHTKQQFMMQNSPIRTQ
jgi:ABC-type lipoprotein export system ATPase subunit